MVKKPQIEPYKCGRCEYEWTPRISRLPKECPQCKSRYWQQERKPSLSQTSKAA